MRAPTTRRRFLRAAIGAVGIVGIGRGNAALAVDKIRPGHGDKASFKSSCDQHGGVFVDAPKDKLTICVWSDGSKTVCDANGNNCVNYPPPKKAPGSGQGPWGGLSEGEITEAPPDEGTDQSEEPSASGGGTSKRRRRGKRRKT